MCTQENVKRCLSHYSSTQTYQIFSKSEKLVHKQINRLYALIPCHLFNVNIFQSLNDLLVFSTQPDYIKKVDASCHLASKTLLCLTSSSSFRQDQQTHRLVYVYLPRKCVDVLMITSPNAISSLYNISLRDRP